MASTPTLTRENRLATMTAASASSEATAGFTALFVYSHMLCDDFDEQWYTSTVRSLTIMAPGKTRADDSAT
jgi:hypothetical protein